MNKTMINFMFNIEIRKKILCLFLTITIILSITIGVARCVPVTEYIDGLKIFSDGIQIKDPNTASIDPNGLAKFKSCQVNGLTVATLDANSHISDSAVYDKHTNLTSSNLTLGSLTIIGDKVATPVDPNTAITTIKIVNGWGVVKCGSEKQHFTTDPNGTVTYDYKSLNSSNTKDTASNLNVYNDPNMALCFQNKTADPNAYIKYEIRY